MRSSEEMKSLFIEPIEQVVIDKGSRDDIPAFLVGIQHLYLNTEIREQILTLMEGYVAKDCDHDTGRPGMNW